MILPFLASAMKNKNNNKEIIDNELSFIILSLFFIFLFLIIFAIYSAFSN